MHLESQGALHTPCKRCGKTNKIVSLAYRKPWNNVADNMQFQVIDTPKNNTNIERENYIVSFLGIFTC